MVFQNEINKPELFVFIRVTNKKFHQKKVSAKSSMMPNIQTSLCFSFNLPIYIYIYEASLFIEWIPKLQFKALIIDAGKVLRNFTREPNKTSFCFQRFSIYLNISIEALWICFADYRQ